MEGATEADAIRAAEAMADANMILTIVDLNGRNVRTKVRISEMTANSGTNTN